MKFDHQKIITVMVEHSLSTNEMRLLVLLCNDYDRVSNQGIQTVQIESGIPYASFYRAIKRLQHIALIRIVDSPIDERVRHIEIPPSARAKIGKTH